MRESDAILYSAPGNAADYREKIQRAAQERAAVRDGELEAQTSSVRDPQERISIWERLHELPLPRNSAHALVSVIAKQTLLTVDQVNDEQRRRAAKSI